VRSADSHAVVPAHAHPPLAVMLVLTQLAVGAFVAGRALGEQQRLLALAVGVMAIAASVLHLGRPLYAWRAVIGIGHSWLSREVVAFGAFAGLAGLDALAPSVALDAATGVAGIAGVTCSVLVYSTTRRTWWNGRATGARFGLTAAALGLGSVACTTGRSSLAACAATLVVAKLAWEATWLRHPAERHDSGVDTDRARTALLLRRDLGTQTGWRFGLGATGAAVLALSAGTGGTWLAIGGLLLVIGGELAERSLFFTAVAAPRMPGALA
jgi:DMSO reductase anchor subunit